MFGRKTVVEMIDRSAENVDDRRSFLRKAGLTGVGVAGSAALLGGTPTTAHADDPISDGDILNFALNLEDLKAEFYSYAVNGTGLAGSLVDGSGTIGRVTGGGKVPFKNPRHRPVRQRDRR